MADDNLGDSYDDLVTSRDHDTFNNEEGFSEYVPTAIDPSPWALVVCVSLCLLLVFLTPFGVALIQLQRRRSSRKKALDAGFLMKLASETEQTEELVRSSTTIETVLGSDLVVQPIDSEEEKLVRYSTTIALERDDAVLALCRPDMDNKSDPLTRYLVNEMNTKKNLSSVPPTKISSLIQLIKTSSAVVELSWKPAFAKDGDDNDDDKKADDKLSDSVDDTKTRDAETVIYALVQSPSGNIQVQTVESKQFKQAQATTTRFLSSRLLGPKKPALALVSKRWRNRNKQESLLAKDENPSIVIDDDHLVLSETQPPTHSLSRVGQNHASKNNRMFSRNYAEVLRKKARKVSIYPALAKQAVQSFITMPERRRRRQYREKTKRQIAMENILYKIYGGKDPKAIGSKVSSSTNSTLKINIISNSRTTPNAPLVRDVVALQSESGSLEGDGNESDSSSSTASEMTDVTLSEFNISDIPRTDILHLQYDENDAGDSVQLVAGWEEGYDQKTQTEYYYNLGTGERSTQCPVDPIQSKHEINLGISRLSSSRPWMCYYCSPGFFRKGFKCLSFDDEMKKILKLAVPYTSITLLSSIFSAMEVAIIGKVLGTNALSAYFAVQYTIDLGTLFLNGIEEALHVTCCQAIGAENLKLAGQYMQLSVWIDQIYFIPFMICFWNRFDDVALWLGFNEETAESAQWYAKYAMFHDLISIYHSVTLNLLDVNGQENYSAILTSLHSGCSFLGLLIFVNAYDGVQLWMIGAYHILVLVSFFLVNISIVLSMGWLEGYWRGLVGSNPLSMSSDNLKAFLSQALPLSIGYVIEYGEWEVLFIFAALAGPAEMAVWGLLGEIWSLAEQVGGAVTAASEVRVAKILGAGKPRLAKYSAEKSLCIGLIVSCIMSVLVLSLQSSIPMWLTNDETLQSLLSELLPLVCLGVAVLSVGSTSWSILCAQGRSHLATSVCAIGSVFISLPLAFVSTFGLNLNLEGLVASLIIGYSISGFLNSLFFMSSNWGKISQKMSKGTKKKRKKVFVPTEVEMVGM